MANLNRVTVMGVLDRDPELRISPNGISITTFSAATSEFWKDKTTDERKEATEWHRISTSKRLAEIASYIRNGEKVYIKGSLRTRKWKDQSGSGKEVTKITANAQHTCTLRYLLRRTMTLLLHFLHRNISPTLFDTTIEYLCWHRYRK